MPCAIELADAGAWILDLASKAFVSLLAAFVGALAALFAIHRTDQRERDKQRRDDIRQTATDFVAIGARIESSMQSAAEVISSNVKGAPAAKAASFEMKKEFDTADHGLETLDIFLKLADEQELRSLIVKYREPMRTCYDFISKLEPYDRGWEVVGEKIIELHAKRRTCAETFVERVNRLREAGRRGFMARLSSWFDRI
jgi:hypothetical protein